MEYNFDKIYPYFIITLHILFYNNYFSSLLIKFL
nr:MAG TPA: hypothetical protein [Caudoviricetes sp.]